jgi:undecaprenyl-diphosphatase
MKKLPPRRVRRTPPSLARPKDRRYRVTALVATGRQFLDWLGSHGAIVLSAVLLVVGGAWGFVELLDKVQEGRTESFDRWAVSALSQFHGPEYRWLEEAGRDITALGGVVVLAILTLFVCGYLAIVRKYSAMWLVLIATSGGLVVGTLLKWIIDRPRPQLGTHLSHVYTQSFPSGHSMMAAVVYLTLGALLTRFVRGRLVKFYFLASALVVTFLVGVSRVYMGVHWPTDVLAGWTAGLVWAILCWLTARWLQSRGKVDRDVDEPQAAGNKTG